MNLRKSTRQFLFCQYQFELNAYQVWGDHLVVTSFNHDKLNTFYKLGTCALGVIRLSLGITDLVP